MGAVTAGMNYFNQNPALAEKLLEMFTEPTPTTTSSGTGGLQVSDTAIKVFSSLIEAKTDPETLKEIVRNLLELRQIQKSEAVEKKEALEKQKALDKQEAIKKQEALQNVTDSQQPPPPERYKLIFYAPPDSLESIKTAVFATGAGKYPGGKYDNCCFESAGMGQFQPIAAMGANPTIGTKKGDGSEDYCVERVGEIRCEILCVGREVVSDAVQTLKRTHPYEEPAYEVYRMEDF